MLYPNTRNVFKLGRVGRRAKCMYVGAGCVTFGKLLNLSGLKVLPLSNERAGYLILVQLSRVHSSLWSEVHSCCGKLPKSGDIMTLGGEFGRLLNAVFLSGSVPLSQKSHFTAFPSLPPPLVCSLETLTTEASHESHGTQALGTVVKTCQDHAL